MEGSGDYGRHHRNPCSGGRPNLTSRFYGGLLEVGIPSPSSVLHLRAADLLGQDFRLRLLVRRHRHSDSTGEPLRDLREVRDQDYLLEDLAHPEELLDEEFPRDLRVEGAEVAFVDEQRLHATEGAADLWHRGEFPCDGEAQGRVDLRLLAPAELRDIVPLAVDSLDEDPDPVTPALLVGLQADATEPTVRELGQILRGLDLQFRQELVDRIHHDAALVEHPIHEDIVDFEFPAERLSLSLRLLQLHRVRFESCDLFFQRGGLSLQEVPRLPLRVELPLQRLDPRLRRAECLLRRSQSREFRLEGRALRLEGLALHREVLEPRAYVTDLAQQDREFIEPLPLPGLFKDGLTDEFQPFLVQLGEGDRVELAQRFDLRVVERLKEPMAIVRLPSKVVFQLLELPPVLREDERVLVDGSDLLVDPEEGLLRSGLFLAQFPDQVGTVREPFQLPRDSRHSLFESPLVSEGAERGLAVDVGPERGDLPMQFVDPVLGLVASLLVLVLRKVELPPRRASGGLALLVSRLRFLQAVPFLPQAVEVFDLFLEGGAFRFEFCGDLALVPDFRLAGLERLEPGRPILKGRRRPNPSFVLRLEVLHLLGAGFEGGLELRHARSALFAFLVQTSQLLLQGGKPTERFFPRGYLGLLCLDVCLAGRESLLCAFQCPFEDLQTEEFLKYREPLRPARGAELLHLLLTDERGVPESIVVEADHVADRPLLVRDRPLHRLSVAGDLEVRFLLGREASGDFPPLVPLAERHADVSVRTAHVREFHALDIRPGRLAIQGERDGVQNRRFAGAGATGNDRVFLRKPERRGRRLVVSHESAHLDLLEDESLRTGRRLQARDRGRLDLRIVPHERASLSTRRASTLIASRFGWSARTLST